jgi:CHAT domain-containing protein
MTASSSRGNQRAADLSTLIFGPLAGTAEEAQEIANQVKDAIVLTGSEATENALKRLQGPRILHIATHGFFLQDTNATPGFWGTTPFSDRGSTATAKLSDPLLRSGLALAGFNQRQSGAEDGVLTALEAASLDLSGTQLVVLSACETGVGQASNGEGVYGLRRAFVMAGAQTQILSLWRVDDLATKDLMVSYYERLQAHQGRSAGLRDVQITMLKSETYQHPYYWAAFIPSGNWQPMQ